MPTLETEVSQIVKENAELLDALEHGAKFVVRYKDYAGTSALYFRHRLSAEHFLKVGVFTDTPEMVEL